MSVTDIIGALLIFTVVIVIHEFGHFLLAKKNGIEVVEFSVGMGPRIVTFAKTEKGIRCVFFCSQKKFTERSDWKNITKYSWKLLPLGGSCAMVGEDSEDVTEGSFNSKGVWARFSVIFAGPFFNFLLAFVFAIIIIGNAGVDMPKVDYLYPGQPAETAGIQKGDVVKQINGKKISIGREISTFVQLHPLTGKTLHFVISRQGKIKKIALNPNYDTYLFGFSYNPDEKSTTEVSALTKGGAFAKAGIKTGDEVISVDGVKVHNGKQLGNVLEAKKATGKTLTFVIKQKGKEHTYSIKPAPYHGKTLGFDASAKEKVGPVGVLKYSLIEVKYWIVTTIDSLGQMIAGKVSRNDISGPVGIVNAVGGVIKQSTAYGIRVILINMLYMSVLLSANLGVMNLLPIPALDGGRLVFILIEAIRGKPVDREKEGLVHFIGFVFLMLLMVLILYNDIWKIVH